MQSFINEMIDFEAVARTYSDPVKQVSRERQRDFIARTLLSFRKPEDVRVVCFPGAEVDGEEAIEVREVYDPLGIPRQNIVGLEVDKAKADRLRGAGLGISVENCLDLDFFRNTERQFDVVSLDYTGQQTETRLRAIEMLVGRHKLNKYGVLCTNFSTGREGSDMQKRLFHKNSRYIIDLAGKIVENERCDSRISSLEGILNGVDALDLRDARDALTTELVRILKLGKRNICDLEILRSHPYSQQVIEDVREYLKTVISSEGYERKKALLSSAGIFTPEEYDSLHTGSDLNSNIMQRNLLKGLSEHVADVMAPFFRRRLPEAFYDSIACLLEAQENKPYFPTSIERYSYNSNKNTMMFMDLFYLDCLENQYSRLKDVFSVECSPFRLRWNPFRELPRRVLRKLVKVEEAFAEADKTIVPERLYLGSSWRPPERISKRDAIELLRSGCSPADISDCYAGFSKMQLAALKAHYVTMGKDVK